MSFSLKMVSSAEFVVVNPNTELFDAYNQPIGTLQNRVLDDLIRPNQNLVYIPEFQITAKVQDMYVCDKTMENFICIDEIYCSAEMQYKAFVVNLKLNEGEVITDSLSGEKEYITLTSDFFEWRKVLEQQEGKIIGKEEYVEIQKQSIQGLLLKMSDLKPYLRVEFSRKPNK